MEDEEEDPLADDVINPAALCNVIMEDWNLMISDTQNPIDSISHQTKKRLSLNWQHIVLLVNEVESENRSGRRVGDTQNLKKLTMEEFHSWLCLCMAVDPNHCFEGHDQQYLYLKFYYASKLSKFTPILLVVTPPPLKG